MLEGENNERLAGKRKRNINLVRKKRLRRNQKKKEDYKKLSRKDRRTKLSQKLCTKFKEEVTALQQKLQTSQLSYKKERQLSAYCWKKWKEENKLKSSHEGRSHIKRINRDNLKGDDKHPFELGKGCFGNCIKMEYRDITVAVKQFETHVKASSVLWEASVINQLDHPGLPLLLGVCTTGNPLLMVTQFHGVYGKCVTLSSALRTPLWKAITELARIFKETAEALQYVHHKGLLHNDVKGDNVIITKSASYHPVLIDFGKCRRTVDAKLYRLNKEEQQMYRKRHWHIAPELVRGTHKQSYESDVFSFGAMINIVSKYRCLKDISMECMNESPSNRPTLTSVQDKLLKLMSAV